MSSTSVLNSVVRSAAVLLSGAVGGQLFVVAASPLLTRLYGPAEFGVLGVYAATLYLVASVAGLRLEVAIPVAQSESDARALSALALLCIMCTAVLSAVATQLFAPMLPPGTRGLFGWALPIGVLAIGFYNVAMNWRLRARDHALIAKTRVLQAISGASIQLGFGVAAFGTVGLICGQILGVSAGLSRLKSFSFLESIKGLTKAESARQLRTYGSFAKFNAPAAVLAIANTHVPTMVIALIASPAAAGLYALVQRVLVTPFAMVSAALSSSMFSHARALNEDDTLAYSERLLGLAALLCPLLTVGAIVASGSFHLIFGSQWRSAGAVAAWVVLFLGQKFIFDSVFSVFTTTGRQSIGLLLEGLVFSARLIALVVASATVGFPGAVMVFSLTSAMSYFLASLVALGPSVVRRPRWVVAGGLDCLLPFFLLYAVLSNRSVVAACVAYSVWALLRIWRVVTPWVRLSKLSARAER